MSDTVYERYINTAALLACQKAPADLINHDELLFQTTHQVSELWMKLVRHELAAAARLMHEGDERLWRGGHLLRRVRELLGFLSAHLTVLESMDPADYMPIRATLGDGSGMDSPGFRAIREVGREVADAFGALLIRRGVTPLDLQRKPESNYQLFQLMQGLLDFDAGFQKFRQSHMMLAMRAIGNTTGTGGSTMAMLQRRAQQSFVPELWEAIGQLSEECKAQY